MMDVEVEYKSGRPIPVPYRHRDRRAADSGSGNVLTIRLNDGTIVKLHGFNATVEEFQAMFTEVPE